MRHLNLPIGLVLLANIMPALDAVAQDCPQSEASYRQAEGDALLHVAQSDSGSATEVLSLALDFDETGGLRGGIVWNMGFSMPNGELSGPCLTPDQERNGEEQCSYWTGIVYTVSPEGHVDLIGNPDDPAAHTILLPGLGRALHYSALNDGQRHLANWDAFVFEGCRAP